MKFRIILAAGDETVNELESSTTNNFFAEAAVQATVALWGNREADNVTCFKVKDDGALADDNFFYAEKG